MVQIASPGKRPQSSQKPLSPASAGLGRSATTPPSNDLSILNHPLARRHYRVGTAAIEELIDLIEHCLRVLIPGALVYARPRIGKTHALDYAALHLARHRADVLVLRLSCEHHRSDFEGTFFSTLLAAVGVRHPLPKSIADKRFELLRSISEQVQARNGHIVILLCDEAQRMSKHALEWLRDVHDQLAYHGLRLITFLVGQPQLMEQRAQYQLSGDEQIVARFMIEHLNFRGIASAVDAATCLASYDLSCYPEQGGATFTQFFYPRASQLGFNLERCGATVWNAFVRAHAHAQLATSMEIPMDYFTRAVESVLLQGPTWDQVGLELTDPHWERAVKDSGYIAAVQTVRRSSGG